MGVDAIEDDLAKRFRIDRPPTLLARKTSKARIGFSRMRSTRPMRGRSLAVSPEEAFAFHVPLSVPFFSNLWTSGRRREVPDLRLGDAQLVDLGDNPVVSLDIPFDLLRFYITQVALDEMANEAGIRRVTGLYAPNFGAAIWSCSVWRKRSPARWSNRATEPRCSPILLRLLFSLTLCALTAASRSGDGPPAAGSRRGS